MTLEGPFSRAAFFVASLIRHPINTVNSTYRGIRYGQAELEKNDDKWMAPALGGTYLAAAFVGAAVGHPVFSVGMIALGLPIVASFYLEVGNKLGPPTQQENKPAPSGI